MKSIQNRLAKLLKLVDLQKIKVIIIITINLLFTGFTEALKNFKKPLGSKYSDISEFYELSGEFKMHNGIATETKQQKKGYE